LGETGLFASWGGRSQHLELSEKEKKNTEKWSHQRFQGHGEVTHGKGEGANTMKPPVAGGRERGVLKRKKAKARLGIQGVESKTY